MPTSKKQKKKPRDDDEQWTIVQVAAFLRRPYQTARNNMLAGEYGPSAYDPEHRRLTVSASRVRASVKRRKH
jgi:hypothetical protein